MKQGAKQLQSSMAAKSAGNSPTKPTKASTLQTVGLVTAGAVAGASLQWLVSKALQRNSGEVAAPQTAQRPACCAKKGSCGYASPQQAIREGPREKVVYVTATRTGQEDLPDYLAVVDVDPQSKNYAKVIKRVFMPRSGTELHHSGYNACASCLGPSKYNPDPAGVSRGFMILPALNAEGSIFVIDIRDPTAPRLHKEIDVKSTLGLTFPHTSHCWASGDILVACMGDKTGDGADGGIAVIGPDFEVKGRWKDKDSKAPAFGYDFWYQPFHNVMVSTEWGAPGAFSTGFNPAHVGEGKYGNSINIWDWDSKTLQKTIKLENTIMPLEVRFLHNPRATDGYCGAALSSNVIHIYRGEDGEWGANPSAIQVEGLEVEGWALPGMPGLITDILISMDDRWLYFSNWLHGDVRQYDISDPANPRLAAQCFVGGSVRKGGPVKVTKFNKDFPEHPEIPDINGVKLQGGPQMLQLSLDGTRLYVTNSLYTAFDKQFYPEMIEKGGQMFIVEVDNKDGGLKLNTDFVVDFGDEPGGPARPHEVRYPGGDCSSDIYLDELAALDTGAN